MNERQVSRRDFMKTVGVVGVGSLMGGTGILAQVASPPATTAKPVDAKLPMRPLGKTGVKVSSLALGGIFDIASNQLQLKQALDWGVTYWDTASGYNGGKSETGIGMYFEKNPQARKSVFLVTKASGAHSVDDMSQSLEQSLERMKTDYVDAFFLHGISSTDVLTPEVKVSWLQHAQQHGTVPDRSGQARLDRCGHADIQLPCPEHRCDEGRRGCRREGRHWSDGNEDARQAPTERGDRVPRRVAGAFHRTRVHA
jgi:hypothetical protein